MSDYKDTLNKYIKSSQARRDQTSNSLMQDILTSSGASGPSNGGAPSVMSGGGGSGAGATDGHTGGYGSKWGNPDSGSFASQYLTTIRAPNGQKVTVHKNSAQAFKGFLAALWAEGYHPKSIQSYSNRNIAGTSTKSEHAWANAIDLDPQANRGDRLGGGGSRQGILPGNINALAKRFGLTWGGTWRSADPMHFEYTRR